MLWRGIGGQLLKPRGLLPGGIRCAVRCTHQTASITENEGIFRGPDVPSTPFLQIVDTRYVSSIANHPHELPTWFFSYCLHLSFLFFYSETPKWPMFQMMDLEGVKIPDAPEIELDKETILKMYRVMARLQSLDDVFYNAQVCFPPSFSYHSSPASR